MLLLAVAVCTIFYSQLCNNFSNFILSLVTKRGRTSTIFDLVNFLLQWLFFLLKLLIGLKWWEMWWKVIFFVILSTILWTKMAGQPFLTQKYPMVVIYFFKLYWFEMARNALKSDFRSSKRGKPLRYIALGNGFASGHSISWIKNKKIFYISGKPPSFRFKKLKGPRHIVIV